MTEQEIVRWDRAGDGVSVKGIRHPFTLPGERVLTHPKIQITNPSEHRTLPACPIFGQCGGCHLQHATDQFVSAWKEGVVRSALLAHGLKCDFAPTHISPLGSRRRAVFSGMRTKKGVTLGFHARGSDRVVPLSGCVVLTPGLCRAVERLGPLVRLAASRKGEVKITITDSTAGPDVSITDAKLLDRSGLAAVIKAAAGCARITWNGDILATFAAPFQTFDGVSVLPPPGAFLQATKAAEEALQKDVQMLVSGAKRVADLFAGSGTFALPVAQYADVDAVESDPAMIAALDCAWRTADGMHTVQATARDLFRRPLLAHELNAFAAVILDPPRAGAQAQIAELARSDVPKIAYVSCDPVTFARDAAVLLENGYRLTHVRVVDQFRYTPHIELVAGFAR